jgi:plastocyanin
MRSCLVVVALSFAHPLMASASDVTGTVSLGGRSAARHVEAVVYLACDRKPAPLAHAIVDQREKTFIPHVSVVTVGTTVQFPNNDSVFHNVFAYFDAKKFDLGMYPRGVTRTQKFDKPGLVAVLCNVHSDMSAYIMVVDTPYYAVTDGKGRFHIRDVPSGVYTLHAWHESGAISTQTVAVKADGVTVNVVLARK